MSELTTSSMRRLYSSAHKIMQETMTDTLAATIDDLSGKLEDSQAQDRLDEIVVLAQGRECASDRLVNIINFVLSIADEYEDE
jgi:hypothetical protein